MKHSDGLTIIVAYHNEGKEFISETINQIRDTADIDNYNIIIVDDGSRIPLDYPDVTVLRHDKRQGVGAAFDTGVAAAQTDNIIIMGSDIRFIKNNWMSRLMDAIDNNQKSVICTNCVPLSKERPCGMDIEESKKRGYRAGASLKLTHVYPKINVKTIMVAEWLPTKDSETGLIEVPVVLGAIYGIKKDWYQYIDGFYGHKVWGTLEPLISIKSYMFGGNCLCHKDIDTGHIFKADSTHNISQQILYVNKIWVTTALFDEDVRNSILAHLPKNGYSRDAKKIVDITDALNKYSEYKDKAVLSSLETLKRMKVNTNGVIK